MPARAQPRRREPEVNKLFRMVMKLEASDLHLKVGQPPMMRLKGDIRRADMRPLTQEDMERLLLPTLDAQQAKDPRRGRRRRLLLRHRQRRMPLPRQPLQAARPAVAGRPPRQHQHPQVQGARPARHHRETLQLPRGTGHPRRRHRLRQEHHHRLHARLHQRARAACTSSPSRTRSNSPSPTRSRTSTSARSAWTSADWHKALKDAVRQDPDVILVGELRDVETFEAAIHAAETGHLVFGTIHASSSATTINRILDLFPPDKHTAIRQALANNLKAVVGPEAGQGAEERPRADQRDHDRQPDRPQTDHQRRGRQDSRRHPHRLPGRHDGFHREPVPAGERGDIDKATALEFAPTPNS